MRLDRRSHTVIGAAVAIIFIVAILRVASSYRVFSQTVDEPIHVAAGYEWLVAGTYLHDPEHPPLARIAFAIAPVASGADVVPGSHGNELLYRDGRYEKNLAAVRAANLPFLILALSVVLIWARRLFGWGVAIVATALFASLPPLLGHAGLGTTDVAGTATTAAALLAWTLWLERPTWRRTILLGISIASGILSKFSFLVFFPAAALVFVVAQNALKNGASAGERHRLKPVLQLAVASLLAFLLIWAFYRFDTGTVTGAHLRMPGTASGLHLAARYAQNPGYEWLRADLIGRYRSDCEYAARRGHTGIDFVDWARIAGYPSPSAGRTGRDTMEGAPPLPPPALTDRLLEPLRKSWQRVSMRVTLPAPFFIAGLQMVAQHAGAGHPAFLLGEQGRSGWWYYFPVVWFFKTPLPFVILTVLGIIMLARRSWQRRNGEALALALAPVAMFIPSMFAGINIGVRHILPIYPFTAIAAAFAVRELWIECHPERSEGAPDLRWGSFAVFAAQDDTTVTRLPARAFVIALLVWQLVSTSIAHPDYLAWFNEIAGDHPEEIALDSNLDWGQDLLRLADDVHRTGIDRLYLSYFGSAIPERHSIPALELPPKETVCGWIAVSEMNLRFGNQDLRWLRKYQPVKRVGKSIRLYNVPCRTIGAKSDRAPAEAGAPFLANRRFASE